MPFDQRRLVFNSFLTLHFSYFPIEWTFYKRKPKERINNIHERLLRIVYTDFKSSFKELVTESKSLNIHHRNLQKRLAEISKLKIAYHLSSWMMFSSISKKPYSLWINSHFRSKKIRTLKYGLETSYRAQNITANKLLSLVFGLFIMKYRHTSLNSQNTELALSTKKLTRVWVIFQQDNDLKNF